MILQRRHGTGWTPVHRSVFRPTAKWWKQMTVGFLLQQRLSVRLRVWLSVRHEVGCHTAAQPTAEDTGVISLCQPPRERRGHNLHLLRIASASRIMQDAFPWPDCWPNTEPCTADGLVETYFRLDWFCSPRRIADISLYFVLEQYFTLEAYAGV